MEPRTPQNLRKGAVLEAGSCLCSCVLVPAAPGMVCRFRHRSGSGNKSKRKSAPDESQDWSSLVSKIRKSKSEFRSKFEIRIQKVQLSPFRVDGGGLDGLRYDSGWLRGCMSSPVARSWASTRRTNRYNPAQQRNRRPEIIAGD